MRPPRAGLRALFAATFVVLFITVLLLGAYVDASFAPDRVAGAKRGDATVPAPVREGGPVVRMVGDQVKSYPMPARTIALTFDDGPDPQWTPQVLNVLGKHQAPATFFVVGAHVAQHPDLARRAVNEGHELGVHTFTHPNMADLPAWRRTLEYSQTQLAIASATGVKTSLLRLPYSSRADAIDDEMWSLMREAGRAGYLNIASDVDSRDWERPGVDAIVRAATPKGDAGAVVLLHDAGGDRQQTVAALDKYIPAMKARGYRFTTVSQAVGPALAAGTGARTVATSERAATSEVWRGRVLTWGVQVAGATLRVALALLILVGVLTGLRFVLLLLVARRHRRRGAARAAPSEPVLEPVSVLVPAFNEERVIAKTVRSLVASDHPGGVEVIVIDDGSTDGTVREVERLGLPNVRLVTVAAGGKAGALNVGIAMASHDLLVMVDGDTLVEPDAIRRLVQDFRDPRVGAIAGNVKVGNRDTVIGRWQHIEYVIGFNLDRRLYDSLGCIPTVAGALGAFRRSAVLEAGGLSDYTLAEDTDLTIALQRHGWRVTYAEHARAWTEAPATPRQLWRQRYRWSYGVVQSLWKHRGALVERGQAGRFGRRGLPLLAVFGVALPMLGPLIDLMAVFGLFFFDWVLVAAGWLGMLAVQAAVAVYAFRMDREPLRPLLTLPLQQLAYRQVMYLVLAQSVITACTGGRLRWQKLHRTGRVHAPGEVATGSVSISTDLARRVGRG